MFGRGVRLAWELVLQERVYEAAVSADAVARVAEREATVAHEALVDRFNDELESVGAENEAAVLRRREAYEALRDDRAWEAAAAARAETVVKNRRDREAYEAMLRGFEDEWQTSSARREAALARLFEARETLARERTRLRKLRDRATGRSAEAGHASALGCRRAHDHEGLVRLRARQDAEHVGGVTDGGEDVSEFGCGRLADAVRVAVLGVPGDQRDGAVGHGLLSFVRRVRVVARTLRSGVDSVSVPVGVGAGGTALPPAGAGS